MFLAAHEMARALGPDKCRGLPAFHVFTGCDTVSSFGGRGKKTTWETWKVCDEVTVTICALGATPNRSIVDDSLDTLERFVVLLYDRTSSHDHVNDARKQLFTQKGRAIDALPTTREALRQHIRRTAYKAGYCWDQMMVAATELPSPSEWGWIKSDTGWDVCWATLTEAKKHAGHFSDAAAKREAVDNASTGRLYSNERYYTTAADSALGSRTCSINTLPQWQCSLMLIRSVLECKIRTKFIQKKHLPNVA